MNTNTKKILAIILCVITVAFSFVACSAKNKNTEPTNPNEVTTDDAVIFDKDAIDLIKSYTPDELGISQEDYDKCSFMIAKAGKEINGKYYVKVIVANKIENEPDENGQVSFSFDTKGEYFIRYDGKEILKKDMSSDEEKYDKLKVKDVPTTEATTQEEATKE